MDETVKHMDENSSNGRKIQQGNCEKLEILQMKNSVFDIHKAISVIHHMNRKGQRSHNHLHQCRKGL